MQLLIHKGILSNIDQIVVASYLFIYLLFCFCSCYFSIRFIYNIHIICKIFLYSFFSHWFVEDSTSFDFEYRRLTSFNRFSYCHLLNKWANRAFYIHNTCAQTIKIFCGSIKTDSPLFIPFFLLFFVIFCAVFVGCSLATVPKI